LAQDVLSPAEEAVYDTLWGVRAGPREERELYRIAQAGYDYLMKRTRLSKKTIQRIVDRLIDKGFIAIEKPADIYQRTSTVYRVFTYRAVLERQAERGRFYLAKIGPGFVYVRELAMPSNLSIVDRLSRSTEPMATTLTGVDPDPTTVAVETTQNIEQNFLEQSTSSELRELKGSLEQYLGPLDDDATRQLLMLCRKRAPDCTIDEIVYFVSYKLRSVNGIQNPVGFILTAVPRHFENNGHSSVRALLREEAARRRRNWEEEFRYWSNRAGDSQLAAADRAEANEVLRSLASSPDRPRENSLK
jgi:predicted transcriptional regulator